MQRWVKRVPIALIFGFVLFRFMQTQRTRAPRQVDLASLQLVNLDGIPIGASVLSGKAMIVNFWAPWCGPCRMETPWLQHLQTAHPDDLLVVGVVADDAQYVQAQAFMRSLGVTYLLARETTSVDKAFGAIDALPTTFYLNRTGAVVHSSVGLTPEFFMRRYAGDVTRR